MKDEDRISPVIQSLQIIWDNHGHGRSRSWRTLNSGMWAALSNAIRSGLRFEPGDFELINQRFRFGRWCGDLERHYSKACRWNKSATLAFEKWKGRQPHILGGKRLHVGSSFTWEGESVTVTSFAADGRSLLACSYKGEWDTTPAQEAAKRIALACLCRRDEPADWAARLIDNAGGLEFVDVLDANGTFKAETEEIREALRRMSIEDYSTFDRKIKRRFSITRADLKNAEKDAKKAALETEKAFEAKP